MKLNDMTCKAAKAQDKQYKLADGNGLHLLVKPNGGKYWRYKYRFMGKENTYAIGVYPEVPLLEARELHREVHKLVAQGIDPSEAKKDTQRQQRMDYGNTFEAIADQWIEKMADEVKLSTLKGIRSRLERHIFPDIGKLPIKQITSPMVIETLRKVEAKGRISTANRVRNSVGQVFRFAKAEGKVDFNPAADISDALKSPKVEHFKAMTIEEVPAFIEKINRNAEFLDRQTCLALKMILLVFTRKKELAHAKWEEFDFDKKMWVIPAERMKMGKEHIVPLSKQVLELLAELKEMNGQWDYVFVGRTRTSKPMHEDTMLRAIYTLGYKGKATIHGFRALAMTAIMEELEYTRDIADVQLAHSKGSATNKAYDRALYIKKRTVMMQDWADYIDSLSGGNVVKGKFGEVV